jgi:hypothetical protein
MNKDKNIKTCTRKYCDVLEFDKQIMQEYADGIYSTNSYMHPCDSVDMWFNNQSNQINANTNEQQRIQAQTFNSVLPFVSDPSVMKAIMEATIVSSQQNSINGRTDKTDGNVYSACMARDLMLRMESGDLLGQICEVDGCQTTV